jgi:hypothetical protein
MERQSFRRCLYTPVTRKFKTRRRERSHARFGVVVQSAAHSELKGVLFEWIATFATAYTLSMLVVLSSE